jgi:transcription-repair coupling factor (superfamily II helicase)
MLDIQDELMDRYGELPKPVNNLLEIALIKALGKQVDMINIAQRGSYIIFEVKQDAQIDPAKIPALTIKYKGKLKFSIKEKPHFSLKLDKNAMKDPFDSIKMFLGDVEDQLILQNFPNK